MKQYIRNIILLLAAVVLVSCGDDYQGDIDKLNEMHNGLEQRVRSLESMVSKMNSQLPQIAALASAAEQGFYITQVKKTSDGYELTLSNGGVIALQSTSEGTLVPMPAISMTKISGFYYWTLGGVLLTGTDGLPLSTNSQAPVVRFDYTLNQWVVSVDGGVTFRNINEYVSIIINDTVLLQVINNYVRQHSTTAISQTVLYQIISTYIQQHYQEVFSVELLDQVVATYIREHYTRIFSYELLEQIFTQYNFSYVKENIKVEELINVIIQFIQEHKEVFVNNEVLYAIITNYIEVNQTTIFTNELLLQVITEFLEQNRNYIDVTLLTQIVNNYIDQHADVVFNTETVRTLLTEYVQKWYVQIFSQDILIRVLNTYVTENSETIFSRTLIEEVINNYIQNNHTTIISQDRLVEIINDYLRVNSTTVFNREVLIDIITQYFEKNYNLYIKREDIVTAVNTYLSTHEITLISVDVISEIVNNYLTLYFREVFTVDLLKQVIIEYFRQHTEVITKEFSVGNDIVSDVSVTGDLCTVTLSGGQTIQLVVYDAMARLSKRVQSLVIMPNSEGRIDEGNPLQLRYLVSPASMAQVIANSGTITMELVTTDGKGNLGTASVSGAQGNANGELSFSAYTAESVKAVALHVQDSQSAGTDIMTDFTLIGAGKQQGYLKCPDDKHPHMINLGLPSGTLWSCCNVGAKVPEDYGGYYAWGETWTKDKYSLDSYMYCGGNYQNFQDIGSDIAGTKYDVAQIKWKEPWRMPTKEQMKELIDNCDSEWVTMKYAGGISGRRFTGSNGGVIFMPAGGCYYGVENWGLGAIGHYWTSTLSPMQYAQVSYISTILTFDKGSVNVIDSSDMGFRNNGLPVRPVAKP